jgi:hypothetical protein
VLRHARATPTNTATNAILVKTFKCIVVLLKDLPVSFLGCACRRTISLWNSSQLSEMRVTSLEMGEWLSGQDPNMAPANSQSKPRHLSLSQCDLPGMCETHGRLKGTPGGCRCTRLTRVRIARNRGDWDNARHSTPVLVQCLSKIWSLDPQSCRGPDPRSQFLSAKVCVWLSGIISRLMCT